LAGGIAGVFGSEDNIQRSHFSRKEFYQKKDKRESRLRQGQIKRSGKISASRAQPGIYLLNMLHKNQSLLSTENAKVNCLIRVDNVMKKFISINPSEEI